MRDTVTSPQWAAQERKVRLARLAGATQPVTNAQMKAAWSMLGGRGAVTLDTIYRAACEICNVSHKDFLSVRRRHEFFVARAVAIYGAKHLTTYSLPIMAKALGGRDPTTIGHAYHRAVKMMKTEPMFASKVARLMAQFKPLLER